MTRYVQDESSAQSLSDRLKISYFGESFLVLSDGRTFSGVAWAGCVSPEKENHQKLLGIDLQAQPSGSTVTQLTHPPLPILVKLKENIFVFLEYFKLINTTIAGVPQALWDRHPGLPTSFEFNFNFTKQKIWKLVTIKMNNFTSASFKAPRLILPRLVSLNWVKSQDIFMSANHLRFKMFLTERRFYLRKALKVYTSELFPREIDENNIKRTFETEQGSIKHKIIRI